MAKKTATKETAKTKEKELVPEQKDNAKKQLEFLTKQLMYTGFSLSEAQTKELEKKINGKAKSFTMNFESEKANFGNKMEYQLNFNRSDKGGVFFNSYDATLTKSNDEVLKHKFAINFKATITAKEALNLLEGRAVKTAFANKESGELTPAFIKFKLKEDKNDYGNFKMEVYNENYGVDTKKIVENSPLVFDKAEHKQFAINGLEKGDIVKVKFEQENKTVFGKAVLNPQYKTINLYDSYMNRINTNKPIQGVEQEQSQEKSSVKQQKASRSH